MRFLNKYFKYILFLIIPITLYGCNSTIYLMDDPYTDSKDRFKKVNVIDGNNILYPVMMKDNVLIADCMDKKSNKVITSMFAVSDDGNVSLLKSDLNINRGEYYPTREFGMYYSINKIKNVVTGKEEELLPLEERTKNLNLQNLEKPVLSSEMIIGSNDKILMTNYIARYDGSSIMELIIYDLKTKDYYGKTTKSLGFSENIGHEYKFIYDDEKDKYYAIDVRGNVYNVNLQRENKKFTLEEYFKIDISSKESFYQVSKIGGSFYLYGSIDENKTTIVKIDLNYKSYHNIFNENMQTYSIEQSDYTGGYVILSRRWNENSSLKTCYLAQINGDAMEIIDILDSIKLGEEIQYNLITDSSKKKLFIQAKYTNEQQVKSGYRTQNIYIVK